jgi:hypothetical protein
VAVAAGTTVVVTVFLVAAWPSSVMIVAWWEGGYQSIE